MTLPTIIALALTVCFFGLLALMLTAPEGHETPGVGFHYGDLAHCPECDAWLRADEGCLHIAPLHHAPSHEAECLEARAAVRPFHHAASDNQEGQRHHGR